MIKNIFFDIGGVLLDVHYDECIQYWADSADLSPDEIKTAHSDEVHKAYEIGQLTDHEYFLAFKEGLPQPCCLKETDFWRGWQKLLGKETNVSELLKSSSFHYNIWLLSNTNPKHIKDELDLKYSFPDYIDGAIYSFDAGARKPDPAIFEYALKESGAVAFESVFIDDLLPNIEAAQILGFKGIHYQNIPQLTNDLNALGVAVKEMEAIV